MNLIKDLLGMRESDKESSKKKNALMNFHSAIISSTSLEKAIRKSWAESKTKFRFIKTIGSV